MVVVVVQGFLVDLPGFQGIRLIGTCVVVVVDGKLKLVLTSTSLPSSKAYWHVQ